MAAAVEREIPAIARAVDAIAAPSNAAAGCSTSAPEPADGWACSTPRKFRPPSARRRHGAGIIAGGEAALSRATETTEDDPAIGVRDLLRTASPRSDVLVGIAASGRTPYVLGAVAEARRLGAVTVGISCTPDSELARAVESPSRRWWGRK